MKINGEEVIKRTDRAACLSCGTPISVGTNYPSQPQVNALELYCIMCKTISVLNYPRKVILVDEYPT